MDLSDPARRRTFFDVHRGLPREAPGNRASTVRALTIALDGARAAVANVVDVACGPGMQTMDLASALPQTRILALDLLGDYVRETSRRAARAAAGDRVWAVRADMSRLPVSDGAADLVWCEGAAYIMGVAEALAAWRPVMREGGVLAFTEVVWLRDAAPAPARAFWAGYPQMGDVAGVRSQIDLAGYRLLGDFVLPPEAWWDDYYGPMERRIAMLEPEYRGDPTAMAVLDECCQEIDIRRRFADWYGYAFFVARRF